MKGFQDGDAHLAGDAVHEFDDAGGTQRTPFPEPPSCRSRGRDVATPPLGGTLSSVVSQPLWIDSTLVGQLRIGYGFS